MNPLKWQTSTIVLVAAAMAAAVAALVYVRAKSVGPTKNLFTGKVSAATAAKISQETRQNTGPGHF